MNNYYKKMMKMLVLMSFVLVTTLSADELGDAARVPILQRSLNQRNRFQNSAFNKEDDMRAGKKMKLQAWIRIADAKDYVPEVRIYFNGMESFNNKEGFLSFPLDEDLQEVSVIFTKSLDYTYHKKNTLRELVIKKSEDYRYFTLIKDEDDSWEWTENKIRKNNFSIPRDCLLIMVNPLCFKRFEHSKLRFSNNILSLPRIVLKGGKIALANGTVSKVVAKGCKTYRQWIEHQGKQSLLHSLGLTQYHEQVREEYLEKPNEKVTLTLTQYS